MTDNKVSQDNADLLSAELHFSYTTEFIEDAEDLFIEAKEKLFNVNKWTEQGSLQGVNIILLDAQKKEVHRSAHTGDHIKFEKDGIVSWSHIDLIEYDDYPDENKESFTICLRPLELTYTNDEHINKMIFLSIERINAKLFTYGQFALIDDRYKIELPSENLVPLTILPILTNEEWKKLLKSFINFI